MNKKLLVTLLGVAVLALVATVGLKTVRADDSTTNYPPLIQKLAEKFNLNQDEVQGVFNDMQQERLQTMQQLREQKLEQAVTDGVITNDQKQALLTKWSEMEQAREKQRQEMQTWFQQQGIDQTKLTPYLGFGHHGGFEHMGMMGWK